MAHHRHGIQPGRSGVSPLSSLCDVDRATVICWFGIFHRTNLWLFLFRSNLIYRLCQLAGIYFHCLVGRRLWFLQPDTPRDGMAGLRPAV